MTLLPDISSCQLSGFQILSGFVPILSGFVPILSGLNRFIICFQLAKFSEPLRTFKNLPLRGFSSLRRMKAEADTFERQSADQTERPQGKGRQRAQSERETRADWLGPSGPERHRRG